jgi:hypothetical protein
LVHGFAAWIVSSSLREASWAINSISVTILSFTYNAAALQAASINTTRISR